LLATEVKINYISRLTLKDSSYSHYKNRFFESPPLADFQKTDFGVSSAFGAGNTKIGFIMRIAALYHQSLTRKGVKSTA
ncbi:MAG: hypothetical protein ACK400_12820, partial [Pseudanabaena sp.]